MELVYTKEIPVNRLGYENQAVKVRVDRDQTMLIAQVTFAGKVCSSMILRDTTHLTRAEVIELVEEDNHMDEMIDDILKAIKDGRCTY